MRHLSLSLSLSEALALLLVRWSRVARTLPLRLESDATTAFRCSLRLALRPASYEMLSMESIVRDWLCLAGEAGERQK